MADVERFELPEELEEFRALVRQIAEDRIASRAAEIDETDEWPEDVYKVLVDNDLMGVGYPEEHGGSGGGSLAFGVLIEELSRVSAGVSLTPLVSKLGVIPLRIAGDDEKARRMTEGIARGALLMSYALTEAGAGSDPGAIAATAERTANGYRLRGEKWFVTSGDVADFYIVMVNV
ncbi:MAG TPA: acyl-CoA dehydrogenase family protein, partial [Actinomycetota bacterium]|nr:acyl-CoA dehydrogenase family protein [Actinomycetota bacterium]